MTQARSRTGQKSKKAPPKARLIQTAIPIALYERVERCANTEMISIAAYVRRMISTYTPGG